MGEGQESVNHVVSFDFVAANPQVASRLVPAAVSKALGMKKEQPALWVERLAYDDALRPVDYEHLYFKGGELQYRPRLDRKRPAKATRRA